MRIKVDNLISLNVKYLFDVIKFKVIKNLCVKTPDSSPEREEKNTFHQFCLLLESEGNSNRRRLPRFCRNPNKFEKVTEPRPTQFQVEAMSQCRGLVVAMVTARLRRLRTCAARRAS